MEWGRGNKCRPQGKINVYAPGPRAAFAAQHAPDDVLPPALPGTACDMYDVKVFPTADPPPEHAAAALIQRAYRASRARA